MDYILPEIAPLRTQYRWVDLFAGEGNLIFPLLELTPPAEREAFFRKHILLYDLQAEMVERCVARAVQLGVPELLARRNIRQQDTLAHYPTEIFDSPLPVYHLTNPPYLYLGYLAKYPETQTHLKYFEGANKGYQDLYQIALVNDLRHGVPHMAYIIPCNFLFGCTISNKIRDDLLSFYQIQKAVLLERATFEHTGVHVVVCFFERKVRPAREPQAFEGVKVGQETKLRRYCLSPTYHYRAGTEFYEFVQRYRARQPLKVKYHLHYRIIEAHRGEYPLRVIDANQFDGKAYRQAVIFVDAWLHERVRANPLFVRTLDTGSPNGRAGLYLIPEVYGTEGIRDDRMSNRNPVQLFLEPTLPYDAILLLKDYFNLLLEYLRELTDSEFMTNYKYSDTLYTRKYLSLTQAKSLIETFPYLEMSARERDDLCRAVAERDVDAILSLLE